MTDSRPQGRSVRRWFAALSLGVVLAGTGLFAPAFASADETTTAEPPASAPASDAAGTTPADPAVVDPLTAAGLNSFAIQPSNESGPDGRARFDYSLAPGESATDYATVSNQGDQPITVKVYPMDAITSTDGSFTIPPASVQPTEVGSWVGINGEGTYTIEPKKAVILPFKVTVPADAIPGEHFGGILVSLSTPSPQADNSNVMVDSRVGARIYLTVPGERNPALTVSIPKVSYSSGWNPVSGKATVSYDVTNTGNVRVSGTSALTVVGMWGLGRKNAAVRDVTDVLPGQVVSFSEEFTGVPPAVKLNATVTLTPKAVEGTDDEAAPVVTSESSIWTFPWIIAAILLIIVLLIVFLIIRGRRTRKKLRALQNASASPNTNSTADDAPVAAHPAGLPVGSASDVDLSK